MAVVVLVNEAGLAVPVVVAEVLYAGLRCDGGDDACDAAS